MIPDHRFNLLALGIENDKICLLPGHVAVDAVRGEFVIWPGECRRIRLMAGETTL